MIDFEILYNYIINFNNGYIILYYIDVLDSVIVLFLDICYF